MEFQVQKIKYDSISTSDLTTMGYYLIKFIYKTVTLQELNATYGQVFKAGELATKATYIISMKSKTNLYW